MQAYVDQGFNEAQLIEILLCLEDGIDVSLIANVRYDACLMKHMRRALKANIDISKCYVNGDLDISEFILLLNTYTHKGIIEELAYVDVWTLENYSYREDIVI